MKLKNEQLLSLLAMLESSDPDQDLPEGVSFQQYNSFKKVYNEDSDHPLYMETFMRLAESFNNNIEDTREALASVQDDSKPLTGGEIVLKDADNLKGKRFVFTSAQNNTDVHTKFLSTLKNYCSTNDAQLIIGQFIYNKSGFQNGIQEGEDVHFASELSAYFLTEQHKICDGLTWCGELNILPTAKNPLSSLETYTGINSTIVPHAKIALESVATPKNEEAKIMYATGAVTLHNYIQKKAGQLAQRSHCYGALIVEIDNNGVWFARQIQTDESGVFQDLEFIYHPDGGIDNLAIVDVINWGDIHSEKSDSEVLECCTDMLGDLAPNHQVMHDLFDMTARNHHNRKSGHFLAKMHYTLAESVENDLKKAGEVLRLFDNGDSSIHIVESNHDLALESWLDSNDYDFRQDPINALIYLELQGKIYKDLAEKGEKPLILQYAIEQYSDTNIDQINFLSVDDSLILAGTECGFHGHIGANGSRGNPNQFQKLNRPVNSGHTHTAGIKGSVYTAGVTGSMDMGYNTGPSSWSHSHIATYPNGYRTIITMKKSGGVFKYRA